MSRSTTTNLCIAAICVALCYVLPLVFHALGGGSLFSPMHLPVLLCGVLCGPVYGALCGLLGPLLSSMLSGMPGPAGLITMIPELMMYGLISGAVIKAVRVKSLPVRLYTALVCAMLAGRIVGGVVSACVYMTNAEAYSLSLWAGAYVVGTLPGIALQLVLIPAMVLALRKTGAINE